MKKPTLLALLGLTVSMTGCGETADSTTASATPGSDVAVVQQTEPVQSDEGDTEAAKLTDGIYLVDDYDPARDASADLQAAIDNAGKTKKRILLEVGGQW